MSVPVREADDGPSEDGPLNYAPKKVRSPDSDPNPGAPVKGDAAPPGAPRQSAEPPWKRSRQREAFAGNAAIAAQRNKLALAPDRIPEPPPLPSSGLKYVLASRLTGVLVVTAVGVAGYQLGSAPPASSPQLALRPVGSSQPGLASDRSIPGHHDNPGLAAGGLSTGTAVGDARDVSSGATAATAAPVAYAPESMQPALVSPAAAKEIVPQSNDQESRDAASSGAASRQLTVGAVRPRQADEAARLTVSAMDAGANAAVVIGGLAPGSALSAGTPVGPNTWRVLVGDLTGAAVTPPRGFVGTMDLTLELHLADDTVADRKGLQLEWSGKSVSAPARSQPRQQDASEIALMMKTGAELMANGDISAARLMYQRLAEAGEAMAAFALAETYDPLMLRKLNPKGGIAPDVGLAHTWYEKAKDLGSGAAPERLERLARVPQ